MNAGKAAGQQPLLDFLRSGADRQLHWKRHHQTQILTSASIGDGIVNGVGVVVLHRLRSLFVKQLGAARKQQLEVVVQLSHGAHCGARAAHRVGLVNRNSWRHTVYTVYSRLVHAV